jgi:hypothetical protein
MTLTWGGLAAGPVLYSFGPRYDLPLPLSVFQWTGAAVVGISFIMMTLFASHRTGPAALRYPQRELTFLSWLPNARWLRTVASVVGVLGLLAVVVTGILGPAQPDRNLAELLTWVYFWAGLAVLTGLVGPVWEGLNPFRVINGLVSRVRPRQEPEPDQERLARWGVWPAVGLFLVFGCLDVTSVVTNRPWLVAALALVYTGFTVVGMQVYGAAAWLSHVEFFSVLFSILGRFAPLHVENGKVYLRPVGAGLLDPLEAGWDWVVFVMLMLSTLAFDALLSTPLWQRVTTFVSPIIGPLGHPGDVVLRMLGFVVLTTIFLAAFIICMELVIYFGTVQVDGLSTATVFALTLVPIAFVYNFAHNYATLVVQSQWLLPLLADPLGRGWRLLPTTGYHPSFLLAPAVVVWYVQVVLIVGGHVIAMYLAHLRAGERFRAAQSVLLSQYPILVLMVLYTMTSLWTLAQATVTEPIVRGH